MNINDLRLRTKSFIPLAVLALTMVGVVDPSGRAG